MEQEKINMMVYEGCERNDKRLTEDFLVKEREKRDIYFKGFVADKNEREGYSDAQRSDVADWLREAYELGKKDGNMEAVEDQVKNNLQGFDPGKIFDNLIERMREAMAPSYFEKLMQCEKIVSDTRAVQVSLLMDKIEEQRKTSPLSWITPGAPEKNPDLSKQGTVGNASGFRKVSEACCKGTEVPCGV